MTRPIRVETAKIPDSVITAMSAHIDTGTFSFPSLQSIAIAALREVKMDTDLAYRLADRYLQQQRRKGRIRFNRNAAKWELAQ